MCFVLDVLLGRSRMRRGGVPPSQVSRGQLSDAEIESDLYRCTFHSPHHALRCPHRRNNVWKRTLHHTPDFALAVRHVCLVSLLLSIYCQLVLSISRLCLCFNCTE